MFYNQNSPFFRPELISYDKDTKIYKYKIRMKETDEVIFFICKEKRDERGRLSSLISTYKNNNIPFKEKHINRFFYNGLIYDTTTHIKLVDIFCERIPTTKHTKEYKKKRQSIKLKIYYRKKNNKDFSNNLINQAKFYNLKIPIVIVH